MKTKLCIGLLLLAGLIAQAQTNNLTALLQQGLFEEQANRNLDAAIADYQNLALQFDKDRQLAATAIFRLGECYRAQGRTNEAAAEYQRIVHDFSDQQTLATLSRQNLLGMGAVNPAAATPQAAPVENPDAQLWNKLKSLNPDELAKILPTVLPDSTLDTLLQQRNEAQAKLAQIQLDYSTSNIVSIRQVALLKEISSQLGEKIQGMMQGLKLRAELSPSVQTATGARRQQKDLLQKQIDLAGRHLATVQKLVQTGQAAPAQADAAESEVLRLRQELAALDAVRPDLVNLSVPVGSEEDREIEHIQQMIQNSPDLVNAESPVDSLRTPLVKAAFLGQLKVAAYLLDHGANVNGLAVDVVQTGELRDAGRVTPLWAAVAAGNKSMAQALLDRGADVNFKDQHANTPLHLAAQKGFQAVIEVLLASHAEVNAPNNNGITPLFSAMQGGRLKIIQTLLAAGADANLKNNDGRTALVVGIGSSPEIFQALLGAGTNPNTEDSAGRTALSYAAALSSSSATKMLLDAKADPNGGRIDPPLFPAIRQGNTNTLELLLRAGANANQPKAVDFPMDGRGFGAPQGGTINPLRFAILQNKPDAVRLLLQFKADAKASDGWWFGKTLVFDALPHLDLLQAMLEAGADPNQLNEIRPNSGDTGDSALMTVSGNSFYETPAGNVAAARMLLVHGANPNFKNREGKTALHYAAATGNFDLVKLLLDNKADPNPVDNHGITPLTLAREKQGDDHYRGIAPVQVGVLNSGSGGALTYQWSTGSTGAVSSNVPATDSVSLLHQYGALDNLPDWGRIKVSRPSAGVERTIFEKGATNWNRFTLLELIAVQYQFLAKQPRGEVQKRDRADTLAMNSRDAYFLPFPDLSHIRIHRPSPDAKTWQDLAVDLKSMLQSRDCAKDLPLNWGDVVEIPENDHPLNEYWRGFSTTELSSLVACLTRKVQILVQNQCTNTINLQPAIDAQDLVVTQVPFWIHPVLFKSNFLLSSSDLSRVKVTHAAPDTAERREWTLDCSDPNHVPDLWLRDGDVIEVPLKP